MVDGAGDRVRTTVSDDGAECPQCGRPRLQLVRSRDVRSGRAKLNPFWDAHEKTYRRCSACGLRLGADDLVAPVPVVPSRRPAWTILGWAVVVLLAVLVAVLTVVLAAMLLVVSVWLAAAVPVVVLVVVVAIAAYARRA